MFVWWSNLPLWVTGLSLKGAVAHVSAQPSAVYHRRSQAVRAAFAACPWEAGFFNSYLPTRTPRTGWGCVCIRILTDCQEKIASLRSGGSSAYGGRFPLTFPPWSSFLPSFFLAHPPVFPSICLSSLLCLARRKLSRYLLRLHFYFNRRLAAWRIIRTWFAFSFSVFSAHVQEWIHIRQSTIR